MRKDYQEEKWKCPLCAEMDGMSSDTAVMFHLSKQHHMDFPDTESMKRRLANIGIEVKPLTPEEIELYKNVRPIHGR